jgi:Chlorite dismutase
MNSNPRLFSFIGGDEGPWKAIESTTLAGDPLDQVDRLRIVADCITSSDRATWILRGATSNERYVTRAEKDQLLAKQPTLGRPEANCAVLIPIRKNAAWWAMTQDERREVFEMRSNHTRLGLESLPAIARRLHHCRDLSGAEPFDFLTWFEFAEHHRDTFDRLLEKLRASTEWQYVDREVEIRLIRD